MATIDYKQKIIDYMNSSEVDTLYKSMLNNLFPELKESEDEKIRKELIDFLKEEEAKADITSKRSETLCKYIVWLEKQGEKIDLANKEYWRGYREGKQEILDKYADFEKQIEQELAFEMKTPEESLGIDSDTYNKIVDECVYGEQKPAWSEEDEKMLQGIWDEIIANKHDAKEYEWKTYDKFLDWLNSIKDRVQPQPKQEWSEEDERTYKSITYSFAHNYPLTVQQQEFVKSFKERYTWKPSDEQLDALHDAAVYVDKSMFPYPKGILMKLYEQIKKLKE